MTTLFHPGEVEVQVRTGGALHGSGIRPAVIEPFRAFLESVPFVAVALEDRGWPVATILEGPPGFVAARDPRTVTVAALPAPSDPAARGLVPGGPVGLLGIDLANRRRARLNGAIAAVDAAGFTIAVQQSYGNCPRYIHPRLLHAGAAAPAPAERLETLDGEARAAIAAADTFFIASGDRERGLDVAHRGGPAGFVRLEGDTLTVPDYAGNRYFNTLGNLLLHPRAGLLFVDLERGDLLHLQGRAEIVWEGPEVRAVPKAERLWRLHLRGAWRRRGAVTLRA